MITFVLRMDSTFRLAEFSEGSDHKSQRDQNPAVYLPFADQSSRRSCLVIYLFILSGSLCMV